MYNILVVDDEMIGRRGVRFLLDKMNEDLNIVEAKNGKEALQYIEANPVDILLTDIKMPFMDGIELIKRARDVQPDMKTVIFSGYNDFEYAKTALSIGVKEYILKPISPEEFTLTIKKVIHEVDEQHEETINEKETESIIKEHVLNNLVNGNSLDAIQKRLNTRSLDDYIGHYKRLILLEFSDNFFDRVEGLDDRLKRDILAPFDYLNLNLNQSLLFFEEDSVSRLKGVATQIYNVLQIHYNAKAYLAISHSLNDLMEVQETVEHMEDLLEGMYYHPDQHIYYEDEENVYDVSPNEDIKALTEKIAQDLKLKDIDRARLDFTRFYDVYSRQNAYSSDYIKYMMSGLIKEITQAMSDVDERDVDQKIVRFYRASDARAMKDVVDEFLDGLEREFSNQGKERRQEVKDVMRYVYSHYNLDLSVDMLADQVCLAPSYLSHIFKKETGENLGKFIKRVRMEKAKDMLENTHEKIVTVAVAVGYSNVSYFCQSFREYYGISPQKYRNQGEQND